MPHLSYFYCTRTNQPSKEVEFRPLSGIKNGPVRGPRQEFHGTILTGLECIHHLFLSAGRSVPSSTLAIVVVGAAVGVAVVVRAVA